MAKSRIGPFALEVPLSKSTANGQVFRGFHLEQKKLAALRVFPIPLGMTPESRQDYADQLEELKNLRHPGIVRCFGGGFDTRTAYLAYQLVDGESLAAVLQRRERLPWETALDFSRQIAEALQFAHERDWFHGRLKPDKVLVTHEGVVKISDWRREAISLALGERRPSNDQLLFSAPELFDGAPVSAKSDLYSLGSLMYFMLTGQPPFSAQGDSLKQLVQNQAPPEVGKSVMDCPVWLSAIVTQLLAKDPAKRPYSMTALLLAFKEAEKRQAQGVGVIQHATAGFSPLQLKADRDEAEKVLGIRPKKKRKRPSDQSFFDQTWVLLAALVGAVGAIVWFLLPLSESTLRSRAEALLPPNSEEWIDWNDARDDYLVEMLERFPQSQHSQWAVDQIAWVDAREADRKLRREDRMNRRRGWTDLEQQYWNAWEFEQFGDAINASEKYQAVIRLYGDDVEAADICYLAREGLQRIQSEDGARDPLQAFVASKLAEAERAYSQAKILEARGIWESIVELYSANDQLSSQVQEAQRRLTELENR